MGLKQFRVILGSSVISFSGTSIGNVAILWAVFQATGSAFDLAITGIAALLPRLAFGLIVGSFLDRYDRIRFVKGATAAESIILSALSLSFLSHGFDLRVVWISVFGLGLGQFIFKIGTNSLVPAIIPETHLGKANGLLAFSLEASTVIGSPLGGLMVATAGVPVALMTDAVLQVIPFLFLNSFHGRTRGNVRLQRSNEPSGKSLLKEAKQGISYFRTQKALLKLTVSSIAGNFFSSLFLPFLVIFVTQILMRGTIVFGILNGLIGAGFAIGSLLAGTRRFEGRFGLWFSLSWGIAGLTLLGLVISSVTLWAGITLFAWGTAAGFGDTIFYTGIQKHVPRQMISRFLSLDEVVGLASSPAGQMSGGILISSIGPIPIFLLASLGGAASSLILAAFSDVRKLGTRL